MFVFQFFHRGIFCRLRQRIQPAQHHHEQDHVALHAAHVYIVQAVVGDGPDERDEFVVQGALPILVLIIIPLSISLLSLWSLDNKVP
jgi:hypothetical protein